jgi:hypothetical protein
VRLTPLPAVTESCVGGPVPRAAPLEDDAPLEEVRKEDRQLAVGQMSFDVLVAGLPEREPRGLSRRLLDPLPKHGGVMSAKEGSTGGRPPCSRVDGGRPGDGRWTLSAPQTAVVLLALALLATSTAHAQTTRTLTGSWRYASSAAEVAQRQRAIEESTEAVPSFMRSRARERLAERTRPPSLLRLAVERDRIELSASGRTLSLMVGGPAVAVAGDGGRGQAQASRGPRGELVIAMWGEGGRRTTTYWLSEDGQELVLDVHIAPERLPSPIRYRLTYRRS